VDLVLNVHGITTPITMEVPFFLIVLTTIRVQDMVGIVEERDEDEDISLPSAEDTTPTISTNISRELKRKEKDMQTTWLDSPIWPQLTKNQW
jgi:hypothetical protein